MEESGATLLVAGGIVACLRDPVQQGERLRVGRGQDHGPGQPRNRALQISDLDEHRGARLLVLLLLHRLLAVFLLHRLLVALGTELGVVVQRSALCRQKINK